MKPIKSAQGASKSSEDGKEAAKRVTSGTLAADMKEKVFAPVNKQDSEDAVTVDHNKDFLDKLFASPVTDSIVKELEETVRTK